MRRQFFRVVPFTNRSGSTSWRVSGMDAEGNRVRENYPREDLALAAADAYEIARVNAATAPAWRVVATRLNDAQVADAQRALEILEAHGRGQTLVAAAEFMRERWRPPENEQTGPAAREAYYAERQAEQQKGDLGASQLRSIRKELKRFADAHPGRLSELTQDAVLTYVAHGGVSIKTRRNRRGILSAFFRWCRLKGWMSLNPFADVRAPRHRRRKGTAPILSPDQAAALMHWLEDHLPRAVPYFALCLFAGIRPDWKDGEIRRLQPVHIRGDLGLIRLPAQASKIGESREITLRPNLQAWLDAYPIKKYHPVFANHRKLLPVVRKKFSLSHDVLRHSFCTYVLESTGSLEQAAREAGNSVAMIRNHYRGALDHPEWTAKFWAIKPRKREADAVAPMRLPRGRIREMAAAETGLSSAPGQ